MSRFFHAIGHVGWMTINLLVVTALLLADICVYVSPERFVLPALLGLGFELLLWSNLLMGISWWFSSRKSWCLVSFVAILLSGGNILRTFSHGKPDDAGTTKQLTVMTYNTHQCSQLKKAPKNAVLRNIRESGADVVCLQEYDVSKNKKYLTFEEAKQHLIDIYPYSYFDFRIHNKQRQFGLAVYSKYPLIHKTSIHYESRGNQSNFCDVVVGSDTIRLFNNHLESNSIRDSELALTDDSEQIKRSTLAVLKKMTAAYAYRTVQSRVVSEEIKASPYPVIVAGDMNDVPVSYTYRTMRGDLRDSFLEGSIAKRGWTFRKFIFGVRIDHIFVSSDFEVVEAEVMECEGSDHLPYKTTIMW